MASAMIAEGKLRTSDVPFEVRVLEESDIAEMLSLQEAVRLAVENPDSLETLSTDEFQYILSGNGYMIGAYVENEMIAFRAMLVPSLNDKEHLGIDAGIPEDKLHRVIYSEITVVHPDFRGNGLQTYMGRIVFDQVDAQRYSYIAATVAPFNIPSLKDKLSLGMEMVALGEKYNGKLRYVLFKELESETKQPASETKRVYMGAMEAQQNLMRVCFRGVAV